MKNFETLYLTVFGGESNIISLNRLLCALLYFQAIISAQTESPTKLMLLHNFQKNSGSVDYGLEAYDHKLV